MTSYFRERFPSAIFAPLAAWVAIAASAGDLTIGSFALDACSALLLLAEFRLRDDLADRDADAVAHPQRTLVRATSVRPFIALLIALALLNATVTAAARPTASLLILVALHGLFAALYRTRSRRTIFTDQLLLAKYPAFVVIIAGARTAERPFATVVAALVLYAAVSIYEAWHDPASPVSILLGGRS